jgi:hypothetical protein
MKFRKIPTVVDAVQLPIVRTEAPAWVLRAIDANNIYLFEGGAGVRTRDGTNVVAKDSDWIVQGVYGELYPVTDKVMLLDYAPITKEKEDG